jgi:hypothetical protein
MWAMSRLQYITNKYPTTNAFWKYMEENWWHKIHTIMVGFQNLPYVEQDTNVSRKFFQPLYIVIQMVKNHLV